MDYLAPVSRMGVPARGDLRAARRLRNRIHGVGRAPPLLTDPEVAERLRQWVAVKPRLLAD